MSTEHDFGALLRAHGLSLKPIAVETLWVNLTRRCNQSCVHCHVDASPERGEEMDYRTVRQCLKVLASLSSCTTLDITGGAPELHPMFRDLVTEARNLGKHVVVRHNLTVTIDGDRRTGAALDDLPSFFADHRVELLVSLPYSEPYGTDAIRGTGVFAKSIDVLRRLNALGYGQVADGLILNIVCNRDVPVSPDDRASLETAFKQTLWERYGIVFNRLYAVTNMPINRYRRQLVQSGRYRHYMERLRTSFEPSQTASLVCRRLVSVGYDGRLYDCDFSQMMNLPIGGAEPMSVFNLDEAALMRRQIRFGTHCFGCTAGGGAS